MIQVSHLKKSFGKNEVLKDVNFTLEKGEVVAIIGPSGTGKSTLLRCMNQLEKPNGGEIWLDEEDLNRKDADIMAARRKMGMVFQSFNLFSHLMVVENIMLAPVSLLKQNKQQAFDRALELLDMVGLGDKAYAYPDELSGGQKQRVAIARAMAMEPEIILFDEPTSALDPTMVSEVLGVIKKLAYQGMTMMIVTHEMSFAQSVATRVFYMDEGIIYEDGPPSQIFGTPEKEKTRAFVHRIRRYEGVFTRQSFDLYDVNGKVEAFAKRYFLTQKTLENIQRLVEEVVAQLLLPKFGKIDPELTLQLSYSEGTGEVWLRISYPGERFDILEDEQNPAVILVKASVLHMKQERNGYENVIDMLVK